MSHQPPEPQEHVFASLRLSEQEFTRYQRATDTAYKNLVVASPNLVKVIGYGEDAATAIKACNSDGRDYIEVPWGPIDSMLWIMQRVEEQIRIPLKVWRLAGDGMVLDPGLLVAGHSVFKKQVIELFLVPGNMMADYLAHHQKEHKWKHLTPDTTDSDDFMKKSQAAFHLLEPKESPHWKTYYEQRSRADVTFQGMLAQYAGEENHPLLEQIRLGFEDTLVDMGFTTDQQHVIADGLVPFRFEVMDNWGDIIEADVMTRIYSPTKPAAMDVYFAYHHITHYESVEFDCRLMYRVHDPVSSIDLAMPHPDIAPRPGFHGWRLVFELGLADLPPGPNWHPVDQLLWGLVQVELETIHAALFDVGDRMPIKEVDKVDTIKLLMAAVGVPFGIAREEDEDDVQDPTDIGTIRWELDQEEWIALNARKLCGVPLERDANYKPRSEYEQDDYAEDEDDDDSDENDDDYDSDDE